MALPIASIPELTGEVGAHFIAQADKTYKEYLARVASGNPDSESYERGMQIVKDILSTYNSI